MSNEMFDNLTSDQIHHMVSVLSDCYRCCSMMKTHAVQEQRFEEAAYWRDMEYKQRKSQKS